MKNEYSVDMRLDQYIVEHFGITRSRAQLLIENNSVTISGKVITKSSYKVPEFIDKEMVEVTDTIRYVSRAGLKIEHAIKEFLLNITGKDCLDIGSSTGGFTDCLLQSGAHHVDCVDVGTDQLHEIIKRNKQVSVYEKTDIRNFNGGIYDVIVGDISFVSLNVIIPIIPKFCKKDTQLILLIKPQFEVGKEFLNKQGIVKDQNSITDSMEKIKTTLVQHGFMVNSIIDSPILGGDGNKEFLVYITIE